MSLEKKRWMTPHDLEIEFRISKSTQSKYRMKKFRMKMSIPFSKIGKFIRYDRIEIDQWLKSHKVC